MEKINEILNKIKIYLADHNFKEDDLSYWLEFFICDHYAEIQNYRSDIARFLNDDVIDICEQTEPGLEGTNFRKEIQEAYDKLLEMIK